MAMKVDLHIGLVQSEWKFSWASRILSVIRRLAMKVDWVSDIRFRRVFFSSIIEQLGDDLVTYVAQTDRSEFCHRPWSVYLWNKANICLIDEQIKGPVIKKSLTSCIKSWRTTCQKYLVKSTCHTIRALLSRFILNKASLILSFVGSAISRWLATSGTFSVIYRSEVSKSCGYKVVKKVSK